MKKWLSILLVLSLMLGGMVLACAEGFDGFVTLNWFTKGSKPADYDKVFAELNAYLKDKINAEVKMNFVQWGDEWDTFVSTQVATNEGDVDIMFTAGWDKLVNHISAGYLIPLNGDPDYGNLLEAYGQDIIANVDPSYIAGNEINGVLYGISCNKELAANHGLLFNADLVDKYDFDLSTVQTLRDIEPMLEVIKEKEPGLIAPFGYKEDGFGFFAPFVEVAGDGNMVGMYHDNRDTTVLNPYATEDWYGLWEISHDWYSKGYVTTDILQRGATYESDFQNGFYFAIPQSMKPGKGAEFSVNGRASYEVVLTPTVIRTKDVSGSMLAIVEGSRHPERAMTLLNLLESDPYVINTILFGLEGVHFNFADKEKGIIEITQEGTDKYLMKGNAWMMGNQFINYITTEESPDKWEQFKAFNAAGTPVVSLGFNFVITPQIAPTLTNLMNVKAEYNALFVGQLDPKEAAPAFNAALEAAGMQSLIDEVQKQFDAWHAQNAK